MNTDIPKGAIWEDRPPLPGDNRSGVEIEMVLDEGRITIRTYGDVATWKAQAYVAGDKTATVVVKGSTSQARTAKRSARRDYIAAKRLAEKLEKNVP